MSSPTLPRRRATARPVHISGAPGSQPQLPAAHTADTPGRWRYDRPGDAWWWSPEMFSLHGLSPDSAVPCSELLLCHQEPADRRRTVDALRAACTDGRPFALEAQIHRADGGTSVVVLVGEPRRAPTGQVTGVDGLCVDLTAGHRAHAETRVRQLETEVEQLRTAMASRAGIEQAKGILMLLTGCGDQVAFDLLAHISSHTHRKVRDVAQAMIDSASGHGELPVDVRLILRDACPPRA